MIETEFIQYLPIIASAIFMVVCLFIYILIQIDKKETMELLTKIRMKALESESVPQTIPPLPHEGFFEKTYESEKGRVDKRMNNIKTDVDELKKEYNSLKKKQQFLDDIEGLRIKGNAN